MVLWGKPSAGASLKGRNTREMRGCGRPGHLSLHLPWGTQTHDSFILHEFKRGSVHGWLQDPPIGNSGWFPQYLQSSHPAGTSPLSWLTLPCTSSYVTGVVLCNICCALCLWDDTLDKGDEKERKKRLCLNRELFSSACQRWLTSGVMPLAHPPHSHIHTLTGESSRLNSIAFPLHCASGFHRLSASWKSTRADRTPMTAAACTSETTARSENLDLTHLSARNTN